MSNLSKQMDEIFLRKKQRRKELAALPVEEKFQILLRLQALAEPILKARGLKPRAWKIAKI